MPMVPTIKASGHPMTTLYHIRNWHPDLSATPPPDIGQSPAWQDETGDTIDPANIKSEGLDTTKPSKKPAGIRPLDPRKTNHETIHASSRRLARHFDLCRRFGRVSAGKAKAGSG